MDNSLIIKDDIDYISLIINGYITFIGDAVRGILYPVTWPLVQQLGGTAVDLGWSTALFSLGRVVITTRMGILADIYRHRFALIIDGSIYVIGGLMWANIGMQNSIVLLYLAQFMLGLGTGSLGVTRSFVSEQCEGNKRTYQLARLSALQYAGFAMTPLIGSGLYVSGYRLPSPSVAYVDHYWAYALPSYIMTCLAIISVCLTIYPFKDFTEKVREPEKKNSEATTIKDSVISDVNIDVDSVDLEHDHRASREYRKRKDFQKNLSPAELAEKQESFIRNSFYYCYWLLAWLNFTSRGVLAIYETMSAQTLLTTYNLSELDVGYIVSIGGTIGTLNLIFYKQTWMKYFNEFQLMLGGFFFQAFLLLLLSNIGPDTNKSLNRFLVSQILTYAFAYPISNSAVLGTFSILQKNGKQSKSQAHFALMGSIARITMPIASGYFTEYVEPTSAWAFGGVLMGFSSLGVILLFKKLRYFINSDKYDPKDLEDQLKNDYKDPKLIIGIVASILLIILFILVIFDFFDPSW